ncbi:Kappa-carrageenase precursor [Bacteroidales bacterium Barb6]|nr:Kappa-carrageenase precursor [Bacteroidales bacterium Barb6]
MKKLLLLMVLCLTMQAHAQSPYIHKVYEFRPAPGQFTNDLPEYEPGDTQADMNHKVEEYIAGENHNTGMISLGGYGGYVVFGFDHLVENKPGQYDFKILANAFYADANPNGDASKEGGSCESGIVMVSYDANGNGIPDDEWYELAGSEYRKPETIRNYRITYQKPDEAKERIPDRVNHLTDITYVRWTSNQGDEGYVARNEYHNQSYWPQWIDGETMVFEGTKLADNYIDESGKGTYFVGYAYHWGYADNRLNSDDRSNFNIEWAIDAIGNKVQLPGIHFVKVYTGVNQYCGWLGEISTEITGAEDLHVLGQHIPQPVFTESIALSRNAVTLTKGETTTLAATVFPENAANKAVTWKSSAPAVATVSGGTVAALAEGTATVRAITNDGYYIAACTVTITTPKPEEPVTPEEPTIPEEPATIPVQSISLSPSSISLEPGQTQILAAVVLPANATDKSVRWASSAPAVAEVTVNGLLFAVAPGTAIITATAADRAHTASCEVTVSRPTGTVKLSAALPQARYTAGQLLLTNLQGYTCTLFTLSGKPLQIFSVTTAQEQRPVSLSPGISILTARNGTKQFTFKLMDFNLF